MERYRDSQLDFTDRGWENLYSVLDDPVFPGQEAEMIFRSLIQEKQELPFCDYLKRFLYDQAGLSGSFRDIPLKEYQSILRIAFYENQTPPSLDNVSTKFSAASANWLTQKKASRQTVLLLGFGLSLSLSEVNGFFQKALHAEGLRASDPRELIAGYCYDYGYSFPKFEELWERYQENNWSLSEHTKENELIEKLRDLKEKEMPVLDPYLYDVFSGLYEKACSLMKEGRRERNQGLNSAEQDSVSPAAVEALLYEGIPLDAYGNLLPFRESALYPLFSGRRLTRKRIGELLQKKARVDRMDLINLNFLVWIQKTEGMNPHRRYSTFVEDTNRILSDCNMGDLYSATPYERFLMMCLLTENPLSVYTEVWEKSYHNPGQ